MQDDAIFAQAMALARPYRISPPRHMAVGSAGSFSGTRDGQSVDFHDYRQYHPGDDLRRVDWLAYARSGQMHLRLFREEVSPLVELHLDASASMAVYPGKRQAALFLTTFLYAATLAAEGRPVLCRGEKRYTGGEFMPALGATEFSGVGVEMGVAAKQPLLPLRFVLSDYLWNEGLSALFQRQANNALHFVPIMVVSESEVRPDWRGAHRLVDAERPAEFLDIDIDVKAAAEYMSRFKQHRDNLALLARRYGSGLLGIEVPDAGCGQDDLQAMVDALLGERIITLR